MVPFSPCLSIAATNHLVRLLIATHPDSKTPFSRLLTPTWSHSLPTGARFSPPSSDPSNIHFIPSTPSPLPSPSLYSTIPPSHIAPSNSHKTPKAHFLAHCPPSGRSCGRCPRTLRSGSTLTFNRGWGWLWYAVYAPFGVMICTLNARFHCAFRCWFHSFISHKPRQRFHTICDTFFWFLSPCVRSQGTAPF